MKSLGVCVGFVIGFSSLPALAASVFDIAQATPAAPAASPPPAAAPAPTAPATAAPAPPVTTAPGAAAVPGKPRVRAAVKPKATGGKKIPSVVNVENKSHSALKNLQISLPGEQDAPVGKLNKEVPAGKTARVALKGAKGCEYKVTWELEDDAGEATVQLCGDPKIVVFD